MLKERQTDGLKYENYPWICLQYSFWTYLLVYLYILPNARQSMQNESMSQENFRQS